MAYGQAMNTFNIHPFSRSSGRTSPRPAARASGLLLSRTIRFAAGCAAILASLLVMCTGLAQAHAHRPSRSAQLHYGRTVRLGANEFEVTATLAGGARGKLTLLVSSGRSSEAVPCARGGRKAKCLIALRSPGRFTGALTFTAAPHSGWRSESVRVPALTVQAPGSPGSGSGGSGSGGSGSGGSGSGGSGSGGSGGSGSGSGGCPFGLVDPYCTDQPWAAPAHMCTLLQRCSFDDFSPPHYCAGLGPDCDAAMCVQARARALIWQRIDNGAQQQLATLPVPVPDDLIVQVTIYEAIATIAEQGVYQYGTIDVAIYCNLADGNASQADIAAETTPTKFAIEFDGAGLIKALGLSTDGVNTGLELAKIAGDLVTPTLEQLDASPDFDLGEAQIDGAAGSASADPFAYSLTFTAGPASQ